MAAYQLSENTLLEIFDDSGLALVLPGRRLVELSPAAVEIVGLLDGRSAANDIAAEIAKNQNTLQPHAKQDVLEICRELEQAGVIELQPDLQSEKNADTKDGDVRRFVRNPDIILREEDPDSSAVLFCSNTSQEILINAVGLLIWRQCSAARTLEEIAAKVRKVFDEAPSGQVARDVQEFVDGMLTSGFIVAVETAG